MAYIGLGSNLENPEAQIKSAHSAIAEVDGIKELAFSGLYQSTPMGPQDQPDYINAVMSVTTSLATSRVIALFARHRKQTGRVQKR